MYYVLGQLERITERVVGEVVVEEVGERVDSWSILKVSKIS